MSCGEAGEKEKESARGVMGRGKREQRLFAFSLFPSFPARFPFFFDYCYFYRDTQREPLWRREVIHSIENYPVDSVIHVLNNRRLNFTGHTGPDRLAWPSSARGFILRFH